MIDRWDRRGWKKTFVILAAGKIPAEEEEEEEVKLRVARVMRRTSAPGDFIQDGVTTTVRSYCPTSCDLSETLALFFFLSPG